MAEPETARPKVGSTYPSSDSRIDVARGRGHVAYVPGEQVGSRDPDVVRGDVPVERTPLDDRLHRREAGGRAGSEGPHRAGGDRVHADVLGAEVPGQVRPDALSVAVGCDPLPIGAHGKERGRLVSMRRAFLRAVLASGPGGIVSLDKIPWPTRGPNVGQTIGSTMRSAASREQKVPANGDVQSRSSSGVVMPDSA
jgi:hypothetical protein